MDYSAYLVPLLLAFTALFGLWKRVNVYDALSLGEKEGLDTLESCLLYTSPSPRDRTRHRMPSYA